MLRRSLHWPANGSNVARQNPLKILMLLGESTLGHKSNNMAEKNICIYCFSMTYHSPTSTSPTKWPNLAPGWRQYSQLAPKFPQAKIPASQEAQLWLPDARRCLPTEYFTTSPAIFPTKLHPLTKSPGQPPIETCASKTLRRGRRSTQSVRNGPKPVVPRAFLFDP